MPPRRPAPPPFHQRLTLARWLVRELGYDSNLAMLQDLRGCKEDWQEDRHPVLSRMMYRRDMRVAADLLAQLDDNIRADLDGMNAHRRERISLKYFQYLAVLGVEYFLHRLTSGPQQLREDLRRFADGMGAHFPGPEGLDDLRKLALWMATGAGKTLLMHLNYRQFLRHRRELFVPDNVILLTPNETLSAQHLEELRQSGIACFRHGEERGALALGGRHPVRVLEMTKLTGGESGRGRVTVHTGEFEGRNLLFVDEGHKGSGGEAWFARRNELARDGFVFEYSATYGQAFGRAGRGGLKEREDEYARSIIFDYSYRHFHGDGYGKDFDVVSLEGETGDEQQDLLMLGNLLVFLQQRACFAEGRESFARHNLQSPLLLLLGARVTGGAGRTDVVNLMRFLHRTAMNEDGWAEGTIARIMSGESGISAGDLDVFAGRLQWLGGRFGGGRSGAQKIYRALLRHVFRADGSGALHFCPITGAAGEVGLRISGGDSGYFGLVYVGNDAIKKLREQIKSECPDVQDFDEPIARPLFRRVAAPESPITILIGAKKFMEGWSSWRVSGMGLLNVGQSEGPLIIQLFGRGVRLQGANMSLKRGGGDNPVANLSLLETMNIFGIRASFVARFRDMLEREGVHAETLLLPVSPPHERLADSGLVVPAYPDDGFEESAAMVADEDLAVSLDISSSALRVASARGAAAADDDQSGESAGARLSDAALDRVDWNGLHWRMREYQERAGLWNLVLAPEHLRPILKKCCAVVSDAPLEPDGAHRARRIQGVAFTLLCRYMQRFHNRRRSRWARDNIYCQPMDKDHPSLAPHDGGYRMRIPQTEQKLIADILRIVSDRQELQRIWQRDSLSWDDPPPRLHIGSHLYQPLLVAHRLEEKGINVTPPALNRGEHDFVRDLSGYLAFHPPADDEAVFLLRNQSRAGVGIHGDRGTAYPDFILWIKRGDAQRIVFVEPHGMVHAPSYQNDPKVHLHETLRAVNDKLRREHRVELDSFIISQTPFDKLRPIFGDGNWSKEKFRDHQILFFTDSGNISRILGRTR